MNHHFPTDILIKWFRENGRDLPWRYSKSPYAVWVSEVMLQQTQVSVVIPYFLSWMEKWPTIVSLSKASEPEVIKMWEGLGYYRRACNLLYGAKYVMKHFGGKLPSTYDELAQIKGLGEYTIGAILSFAFHQKAIALDGNAYRVYARFFAIDTLITLAKTKNQIKKIAWESLPENNSWHLTEGIIELGATICTKKPLCQTCPLKVHCTSYKKGLTSQLPIVQKREKTIKLYRETLVIVSGTSVFVQKGEKGKVMESLHEFPYFEKGKKERKQGEECERYLENKWGIKATFQKEMPIQTHTFTKYHVTLFPKLFFIKNLPPNLPLIRQNIENLAEIPFSSGHRKVAQSIIDHFEERSTC